MARKIRFRQRRLYNLKILVLMVAFFIILAAGLLAVDFNKSYVIYGQPKFEIFKIEDLNNDIYRVWLMDSDFNLNLKYLKRDIKKLENYFK